MDGELSVYEQNVFMFAPSIILIPGPLCYVKKIIAIVTITGEHILEAFMWVVSIVVYSCYYSNCNYQALVGV